MGFCFFIGHRNTPESLYPELLAAVEAYIEQHGVKEFRVGRYGAFDRMAACAVRAAKEKHPEVQLILVLPYLPVERRNSIDLSGFDSSVFPDGLESVPPRFAISHLNRKMAQQATHIIAYVQYAGGASKTLEIAEKRTGPGRPLITNLINAQPAPRA